MLTQNEDYVAKPVIYYSRKLLPRERNYSTVEKELLAIMAAIHVFAVYIGHGAITIYSDHHPLGWLSQAKTSNQRILRWALLLSEYDLTVKHVKGVENRLADLLRRHLVDKEHQSVS